MLVASTGSLLLKINRNKAEADDYSQRNPIASERQLCVDSDDWRTSASEQ